VMMPLFFVLFVGLAVYIFMQPGSTEGYKYIFRVDPVALKDPMTWVYALGQAFFSLSIAGNGTVIYGSYLSDDENIPASAARVAFFDTLAACLAALVIIPAMATAGSQLDQGGPGLMFIFLPHLFHGMPGGSIFAIIFFVAVLFAGMTSLLNLYETPIATLQEKFGFRRIPACLTIGVIGAVVSILIQGIVSGWMDVLSIYICPLGAGLAAVMFFWFCKKEFVESEVNKGRNKPVFTWFYPLCKYVLCPICFIVLVLGAMNGGIG
ncbi:MAG: sodium-dependent transporter, partial [Anaerotignum sp.]|nr:sodium-dependent transporter [Anaerotignum sp.]